MKVLLVDDDRKVVAAVRRGLESEGFTVDTEFNGIDGLWRATEGSFDVIVLDILARVLERSQVVRRFEIMAIEDIAMTEQSTPPEGSMPAEVLDSRYNPFIHLAGWAEN